MSENPTSFRASKLEDWEIAAAAKLRELFAARPDLRQKSFGAQFEIGSAGMVSQYLHARRPLGLPAAIKFARGLKVSVADISPTLAAQLPKEKPPTPTTTIDSDTDMLHVPVLANAASMGNGAEMAEEDVLAGALTLSPRWVSSTLHPSHHDALRFIHGYGDSMIPTFASGDVLLVDTGVTEVRIDGVFVLRAHDRLFIKRVRQRMDGRFEISSDNPTHKTVDTLSGDQSVQVLGRVIWVWNGRKI